MKLENIEIVFSNLIQEMSKLKNDKRFDYLAAIIGEDFGEEELGCIYTLENTQTHGRTSAKAVAQQIREEYVLDTVPNLWKAVDILEREVYNFLGVKFLGHKSMRRLYSRNGFKGYPLRKNFNVSPENNQYTLEENVELGYTFQYSLDKNSNLVETRAPLFTDNNLVINIGPQHPSTHGVLRLQSVLDSKTVKRIYPRLGYIHCGMEKMCEAYTYPQTLTLTDRMDYLSAMMNRYALVGVIKEATEIELTECIQYIRTIMDELQRIDSYLLYLGYYTQDLGALTAFLYSMRDREHVLNVMEETTGGRLIQNYYRIGGCQDDIDPNFVENTKELCAYLKPMLQEYMDVFGDNAIIQQRFKGIAPMSLENIINYDVTGAPGRASGWKSDVRKYHSYAMYDKIEFEEVPNEHCDSFGRYLNCIEEIKQSVRVTERLIDNTPAGDFYVKQKPITKVPEGQRCFSCEGSRGEIGVYLDSKGDKMPYRLKFRPMGLNHVAAMDKMLRGQKTADLVTAGAALGFVTPDTGR